MQGNIWEDLVIQMTARRVAFDLGLSDAELRAAESWFELRFPPDLREFLQTALPKGKSFPDWRSGDEAIIRDWLDLPRQGVLFDVEHNGFWLEEWGPRPPTLDGAKQVAEQLVAAAPTLIPVFGHRMIPAEPHLPGNPVFSVHRTDIIVYGTDLRDYFTHEFVMTEEEQEEWTVPVGTCPIRFWNTDRFQEVRWAGGPCFFDNSRGLLP
jgi:hypothetical protein